MNASEYAQQDFEQHIHQNSYPGRGLVIGQSPEGDWLLVYWIMGRSAQSRNRRFRAEGGTLRTEPIDAALLTNPSLLIYDAMLDLPPIYLVSNGDQTRTLYDTLKAGGTFDSALATREREPDAPNFTPRISGMLDLRAQPGTITLSLLKANPIDSACTDRITFRPALPRPGFGFGLTTYAGDGTPLPSFSGDPLLLPFDDTADHLADHYWNALNPDNRVALAVKHISRQGTVTMFLRNR